MQDINSVRETHGVNDPPRAALIRNHDFEHARAAEPFEGFDSRIDLAFLSSEYCVSDVQPDRGRRSGKSSSDVPTHLTGFSTLISL